MTSLAVARTLDSAVVALKEQAAHRAFEDLIVIALETGNVPGAKSRFAEAQEVLNGESLDELVEMARGDYGVELLEA